MQAREQKAVGSEIRVREQRVIKLTESRDDAVSKYGKADRAAMIYQDMLDDAARELAQYKTQFGL